MPSIARAISQPLHDRAPYMLMYNHAYHIYIDTDNYRYKFYIHMQTKQEDVRRCNKTKEDARRCQKMKETEVIITQTSSKKSERIELQCHVFTAAIYAYTCLIWQETAYAQPSGRRVRFPFAHDSMFSSYGSWLFLDVFRRMVLRMILVILKARR